jgi:hypothetical protein
VWGGGGGGGGPHSRDVSDESDSYSLAGHCPGQYGGTHYSLDHSISSRAPASP